MNSLLTILKEQKQMQLKGNIYHNTQIMFAYNTNHIEGSTLTEEQTRYIFETNTLLTDPLKTGTNIDDILEMMQHFRLFDAMLEVAHLPLTIDMIKEFHQLLKSGTSLAQKSWFQVGDYKLLPNEVGGIITSSPDMVCKDMNALLTWYQSLCHISLEDLIYFHATFEHIHPFQDGNGRIGRIILFKECLRHHILPFIVLDKDKLFYYRGLHEYQTGGEKGYLIDTCLNAQDQYRTFIHRFIPDFKED